MDCKGTAQTVKGGGETFSIRLQSSLAFTAIDGLSWLRWGRETIRIKCCNRVRDILKIDDH